MYRRIAVVCVWAWLSLSVMIGCDAVRSGYAGVQDQQQFQRDIAAAGLEQPGPPAGSSTAEIIAYVAGSLGVLVSGLFLGKKYMPRKLDSLS